MTPRPAARVEATRAELEAMAANPPKGMSKEDLRVVQQRLASGDFNVGSRILIQVQGDTIYSDTFTVRTGRVLLLPALPPLSLEGVLRSESDSVIGAYLAKYLRNPEVEHRPAHAARDSGRRGEPRLLRCARRRRCSATS